MNEFPQRNISSFPSSQHARATWATSLSFLCAGIWSLVFAALAPLPTWLAVVLLMVGFAAIFIGIIAMGVEIDAWRKRHG